MVVVKVCTLGSLWGRGRVGEDVKCVSVCACVCVCMSMSVVSECRRTEQKDRLFRQQDQFRDKFLHG